MGTTMTAERALGLREKAQERFEQLENEMKAGQSDPEAWEMARRAVEFYERQAEILKVKEAEEAERQAQLRRKAKAKADRAAVIKAHVEGLSAVLEAIAASNRQENNVIATIEDYNKLAGEYDRSADWEAIRELNPIVGLGRGSRLSVAAIIRSKFARLMRRVDPQHYGPFEVQFGKPFDLDQIQRLRDSIAGQEEKQPAATSNGHKTKKGSAA
jgi:hypothetical protein